MPEVTEVETLAEDVVDFSQQQTQQTVEESVDLTVSQTAEEEISVDQTTKQELQGKFPLLFS